MLAIDETLTRRRGPKVFAASWWHDGSAPGATKIGYGNSWVVLAIVVTVPFCRRPIALPILFALCVKGGRSKPDLARDLLDLIAEAGSPPEQSTSSATPPTAPDTSPASDTT